MTNSIQLDVWLYGSLTRFGGESARLAHANLHIKLPAGSTVSDLLDAIPMPTAERGITFINGNLSAMPGLQPDLNHVLQDNDRIAFFDPLSMWPFQYRHGAAMIPEMAKAMQLDQGGGLHHNYND